MAGKTLYEKIWENHVVVSPEGEPTLLYIDLHLVHEVTSPQAFDGLRLNGRSRSPSRPHTGDGRSQRAHVAPLDPDRGPHLATPARGARRELRGVRHHRLSKRPREPGHRPRDRSRARRHPAGHDHRLRRLAHLHPRRARLARLWHRHQRGRARPRHPDTAPAEAKTMAVVVEGTPPPGVTAKDIVLAIVGRLAPGAARATSSSTAATQSRHSRWRAV